MRTLTRVRVVVAVLAVLVAGWPAVGQADDRIVGGRDATEPYGFVASLHAFEFPGAFCSGSLLDPRWVLTARHCVKDATAPDLQVSLEPDPFRPHLVQVKAIHGPPPTGADLALLELSAPAAGTPIGIAGAGRWPGPVRILGFGDVCQGRDCDAHWLQELDTSIVSPVACRDRDIDPRLEFCVQRHDRDGGACQGDSGGPAARPLPGGRWVLLGALSRGNPKSCRTGPDVYTDAWAHRDWIARFVPPVAEPTAG
ncbi:S1 family peptidase [Actinosynnema sp. NPDC059335]|uniref:S1 family peptidase n=1 Tax=Actinosynnema sp. NPDC059335 TaxID=3346804 RepID=UPI00366E1D78